MGYILLLILNARLTDTIANGNDRMPLDIQVDPEAGKNPRLVHGEEGYYKLIKIIYQIINFCVDFIKIIVLEITINQNLWRQTNGKSSKMDKMFHPAFIIE